MQDEYRLLAVDRPGFGLTDRFCYAAGPEDLRAHALSFLDGVLDALGLDRVVANSMGALWSLWLAAAASVRRLLAHGDLRVFEGGHLPWLTSPRAVAAHATSSSPNESRP